MRIIFGFVCLVLAGCGGGGGESDDAAGPPITSAPPTTVTPPTNVTEKTPPPPPTGAEAWSDEIVSPYSVSERDVYELSRDSCSVFSPKQVAREYKAESTTPRAAAHAFAQTSYQPVFRPAALAGCLAGFSD